MSREKAEGYIYYFAHISLFIIFFWFGIVKFFGMSSANELIDSLRAIIIPWWPFASFIIFLATWEVLIGIFMLFRKTEKLGIILLVPHMLTTFLPLYFLTSITWQSFLIPTLEGQYIIKNIIIVALAASVILFRRGK
jgi:uncharacterized membrane protein YkgB